MESLPHRPVEPLSTDGTVAVPRQAATVVLMRGGARDLEVLLVRRTPKARFMAGVWVFPGGAVDAHEGEGDRAHRLAAVRELEEEASITGVDPAALVKWSRWITPPEVRIRFDTHFFLADLPAGQEARIDGEECVDVGWLAPREALDRHHAGELPLVFPTIAHLEQFAAFPSAAALTAHARGRTVEPVEPRVRLEGGEVARVVLPWEPGYGAL
jgi:8-oxo-dGTP pyrophosphatase MutT (NUDIX family)